MEYKWIADSQSPHMAMSVSCGEVWGSRLSRIFLNWKSGIPKNVRNSIVDTLTYFREFFLLLCCRTAWCSWITIMLKIMPALCKQPYPRWIKTYSKSRIELRNLQILKKMLEKSSQFLSSDRPCEPKSLDVALKITGVEKIPSENMWLRSTQRPFDSRFEW